MLQKTFCSCYLRTHQKSRRTLRHNCQHIILNRQPPSLQEDFLHLLKLLLAQDWTLSLCTVLDVYQLPDYFFILVS